MLKFHQYRAALATLVVLGVGLLFIGRSGEEEIVGKGGEATRSDRVLRSSSSSAQEEADLARLKKDLKEGKNSPRTRLSKSPIQTLKNLREKDAPQSSISESSIAETQKEEKGAQKESLRMMLLKEAARRAVQSEDPAANLTEVALVFRKIGQTAASKYWFERAALLAADPDEPKEAAEAMRIVVKGLVKAGFLKEAEALVGKISLSSQQARAQAELVAAFAKRKSFARAHQLAHSLSDAKARSIAITHLAKAEARSLPLSRTLETLGSIPLPDFRDRAAIEVAAARAQMKDLNGAQQIIRTISKESHRDRASAKVAEIQARGGSSSIDSLLALIRDPVFRDQAMVGLIHQEAARRGIKAAERVVEKIRTSEAWNRAQESLVHLQLNHGQIEPAKKRARGLNAPESRQRALQAVAVAEVKSGGVIAARQTAELLENAQVRDVTYQKIASRAIQFGQSRDARETIRRIHNPSQRIVATAGVALTQAKRGHSKEVRDLIREINYDLGLVDSPRAQDRTQGLLAEALAVSGESDDAFKHVATISQVSLRDRAYQKMALSFAKGREIRLADRSIQMIEKGDLREKTQDSVAAVMAAKIPPQEAIAYASRFVSQRQQIRFLLGVVRRSA